MITRKYSYLIAIMLIIVVGTTGNSQNNDFLRDTLPEKWSYSSEFSQTLPTEDRWWLSFEDKCLDSLIEMAVTNNFDVLMAQKRIAMAKNAIRIAQSGYFPNLSIGAGWAKERSSGVINDNYNLGLNFNWEIDLFGQITSQAKEKKALWQASKAQYEGTMVALCANIATAYINLRMANSIYCCTIAYRVAKANS